MGIFPQLRYEPTAKRVRARLDGTVLVDTIRTRLVWEPRRVTPIFAVPEQELRAELKTPALPAPAAEEHAFAVRKGAPATSLDPGTVFGRHTCAGEELDVVTGGARVPRAAFRPEDPGQASYWSHPGSGQGRDIAWSYDRRFSRDYPACPCRCAPVPQGRGT